MNNIQPIARQGGFQPVRSTIDAAPGFGDSLDALLGSPKPSAPTPGATPTPGGLQFSRHAAARMQSRGIELSDDDVADLSNAIDKLRQRGAKESLLLLDDHAFIVGVPDRKVITALTRSEAVGNIFSQIDSTVVVR